MKNNIVLFQSRICETLSGNLAYTVGRLAFRRGRPMLVEHVGGIYLEHDLQGRVLTEGYGPEYNVVHVWEEETTTSGLPTCSSCMAIIPEL
jgi:hypothetical protein